MELGFTQERNEFRVVARVQGAIFAIVVSIFVLMLVQMVTPHDPVQCDLSGVQQWMQQLKCANASLSALQ